MASCPWGKDIKSTFPHTHMQTYIVSSYSYLFADLEVLLASLSDPLGVLLHLVVTLLVGEEEGRKRD